MTFPRLSACDQTSGVGLFSQFTLSPPRPQEGWRFDADRIRSGEEASYLLVPFRLVSKRLFPTEHGES